MENGPRSPLRIKHFRELASCLKQTVVGGDRLEVLSNKSNQSLVPFFLFCRFSSSCFSPLIFQFSFIPIPALILSSICSSSLQLCSSFFSVNQLYDFINSTFSPICQKEIRRICLGKISRFSSVPSSQMVKKHSFITQSLGTPEQHTYAKEGYIQIYSKQNKKLSRHSQIFGKITKAFC